MRIIDWTMNFGYSAMTFAELQTVRRRHGFSLIELLIAVVVVAILTAIAFPSYQGYMRKGSRAAAQALLIMEQRKITSLVVAGPGETVAGVIQIHDLWRTELF